jgi:predicted permease
VLGNTSESEEPRIITATFVSDNFFSVLGVEPYIGRNFRPEEINTPGREALVVLSNHFWQNHFGADSNIVGQSIRLNGKSFVVIGVTTREFVGFGLEESAVPPDVWLPLMMSGVMQPQDTVKDYFGEESGNWLRLVLYGRLKPGKSIEEGRAEVDLLTSQLSVNRPTSAQRYPPKVIPQSLTGDAEIASGTWIIMGFVLTLTITVLLVACANITSLLLARALARRKEIGLRLSIGASRGRLIRQFLTESLLLASLSGTVGLLLAWWSLKTFLASSLLSSITGGQDLSLIMPYLVPDKRVLLFTLTVTVISTVAFGLAPAVHSTRGDLTLLLKEGASSFGSNIARSRLSNALVIGQVAISLVLLIAAALIVRGLGRIGDNNLGFNTKDVLVVDFSLKSRRYDPQREDQFRRELATRFEVLPGVQSVSQVMRLPFDLMTRTTLFSEGLGAKSEQRADQFLLNKVTENYFNVLDIGVIRGRAFSADEVRDGAPVLLVTESTAHNLWPDEDPIGKKLGLESADSRSAEVIGVVQDIRNIRSGEIDPLFIYEPLAPARGVTGSNTKPSAAHPILVRAKGDPRETKASLLATAQEFDPTLLVKVNTVSERIARIEQVSWARPAPRLLTSLGLFALLLTAVGLYSVLSYSVTQRRREIGIRMALGASRKDVVRVVIRQGMRLVGIGLAIGIAGGLAFSYVITSVLFGLSPLDPVSYVAVSLFLLAIGLVATFLPASRAASVDPMVALRRH